MVIILQKILLLLLLLLLLFLLLLSLKPATQTQVGKTNNQSINQ